MATCSGTGDEYTAAMLDTLAGTIFTAGNNAYPYGSDSAFANCYDPSWGRHRARTRPAPGDQEYATPGATGYYNYFGAAAGDRAAGYYSYELGTWHVVVLNSNVAVTPGSAQEQWLRADLAASGKACTLAIWQLPLFSSGQSGSFSKVKPLWQALYDHHADVVLNGKERDYERFAPQTPDGVADPVSGIREFVAGIAGAGTSTAWKAILPNSEARYLASVGLLEFTLGEGSYSWRLIPARGGGIADSGTATCVGATENEPPTAAAGGPYDGSEGTALAFDGSGSSDPDGDALSYDWSFGDGSPHASAVAPTHAYADNGSYTVTLTVSDGRGGTSSAMAVATIGNLSPSATFIAPETVTEGSNITLALTQPHDPAPADSAAGFTYAFDCGVGAGYGPFAAASSASCTTTDDGSRVVRGKLRDKDGGTTEHDATVTIVNAAPTVSAGRDTVIGIGQAFQLAGSFTDPGAQDGPWAFTVDWGDGSSPTSGLASQPGAVTATHAFTAGGTYTVILGVTDKQGAIGAATMRAIVDRPPVVTSTGGPYSGSEGAIITVSASASDPDGDQLTYAWSFGDGSPAVAGMSANHAYRDDGNYTVTLAVTDAKGARVEQITTAAITNLAPVVGAVTGPTSVQVGASTSVSASFADAGTLDSHTTSFDWGDGTATAGTVSESNGSGTTTGTHSFAAAGTYTVRVTVTDDDGLAADGSVALTVTASSSRTLVADPGGPYTGVEGSAVTFDGTGSFSPSNRTLKYDWSFGDGSAHGSGSNPTHVYSDNGTYTVTLVVSDKKLGKSAPQSTTATIANAPPAVGALSGPAGAVPVNSAVSVSANFTDSGTRDTHTASFSWGDGLTTSGAVSELAGAGSASGTHTYTTVGTFAVRLTVTDKDGAAGTGTRSVTVTSAPPPPSGDSAILVGAGDISHCGSAGAEQTARILDTIAGTVFVAGDGSNDDGTVSEYEDCYGPAWGRHKARTQPAPGNHDYSTANAAGYFQYFGAAAGEAGKGYYSYDLGRWHVVVLNSNIAVSAGSAQEQWLRQDLAAHNKQCTLAYWHHPRFNSGAAGNNSDVQPLWQALYDYGAEIVVNGHEHVYERFAPQTPSGAADPARGIRQFTVGTGGAGNTNRWGNVQPNSEVRFLDDLAVLRLTLRDGSYSWKLVTASEPFNEGGSGTCH